MAVILRRYLASELARGWLLVSAMLVSLFALLGLIEEMDNLNQRYGFTQALSYVALTTPQRVLELAPVIAALGTVMAFARLARASETVIMRGAGISLGRLIQLCSPATLALLLFLAFSQEFYVAAMHQHAETERGVQRSGNADLLQGRGIWASGERRYFNVRNLRLGQVPEGISLFEFSSHGALLRAIFARSAQPVENRQWKLVDVLLKEWHGGKVTTTRMAELELGPFWSAEELPVLGHTLASMPPSALYEYDRYLQSTGQPYSDVRMAFWQKIALPFSTAAMVLFCTVIGSSFGSARASGFGWRVIVGAVLGAAFYLLTQIIHTGGQLLGLDAPVIVLIPVVTLLLLSWALATISRRPD